MEKDTKQLLKEINEMLDFYIPHKKLISIPVDDLLFPFLNIRGVYILYVNKAIIYVGCSVNVGVRLRAHRSHLNYGNKITKIDVIRFFPKEKTMDTEARLIEEFKPYYNKTNHYLNSYVELPLDFMKITKQIRENMRNQ